MREPKIFDGWEKDNLEKNQGYGTLFGETKDKQVSNLP